jgi:hypothetical protein
VVVIPFLVTVLVVELPYTAPRESVWNEEFALKAENEDEDCPVLLSDTARVR